MGKIYTSVIILWSICLCLYGQERVTNLQVKDLSGTSEINLDDSLWNFFLERKLNKTCPSLADLQTSGWGTMRHTNFGMSQMLSGWQGRGWFVLPIKASKELIDRKLSFRINHEGASEIFLDGKPLGGFGKIGNSARETKAERAPHTLIELWLPDTAVHLLALHYVNYFGINANFWGFHATIGDFARMDEKINRADHLYSFLLMSAAVNLILALLHVFLFFYNPNQKLNLESAGCTLIIAIISVSVYQLYQTSSPTVVYYANFTAAICKMLLTGCALLMIYRVAYTPVPRWRLAVLCLVLIYYVTDYMEKYFFNADKHADNFYTVVLAFFLIDVVWSTSVIIRNRQKGAWIIGVGMLGLILVYLFTWGDVFNIWTPDTRDIRMLVLAIGILLFPVCFSLYQAINFTTIQQQLNEKCTEIEDLLAKALYADDELAVETASYALPGVVTVESAFLGQVAQLVNEHLEDESFGADQLASAIGMSRAQLHRKLKASLGQSAGGLIRTTRMEHAYNLLKQRMATVAEVSYKVGFSNPSSFSSSFSRHFGFPPSKVEQEAASIVKDKD